MAAQTCEITAAYAIFMSDPFLDKFGDFVGRLVLIGLAIRGFYEAVVKGYSYWVSFRLALVRQRVRLQRGLNAQRLRLARIRSQYTPKPKPARVREKAPAPKQAPAPAANVIAFATDKPYGNYMSSLYNRKLYEDPSYAMMMMNAFDIGNDAEQDADKKVILTKKAAS